MERKEFKAESKRLLDLMINSIYTHKEIFLREIISNASDAIDKLCYLSLTDDKVGLRREAFAITLIPDEEAGTLTVRDNGCGVPEEVLAQYRDGAPRPGGHFGLHNVDAILRIRYGPDRGVRFRQCKTLREWYPRAFLRA